MVANPLRMDPTRTTTLRRTFQRDLVRRFNKLLRELIVLVVEEDAFGLKNKSLSFNKRQLQQTINTRWEFSSDEEKTKQFSKWLQSNIDKNILETTIDDLETSYLKAYVEEGYKKGAGRAFDDIRKAGYYTVEESTKDFYAGTKAEFLRSSFSNPESISKIRLLTSRTFTDLKGVTEVMATQMTRALTDGLVQGQNPRQIARTLANRVDKIGKTRARTIARTEIIRAHAEGQLDSFETLGEEEVAIRAEWTVTHDSRLCELCRPMDGRTYTIKQARGLIPRHPNCRCGFIPANVGEKKKAKESEPKLTTKNPKPKPIVKKPKTVPHSKPKTPLATKRPVDSPGIIKPKAISEGVFEYEELYHGTPTKGLTELTVKASQRTQFGAEGAISGTGHKNLAKSFTKGELGNLPSGEVLKLKGPFKVLDIGTKEGAKIWVEQAGKDPKKLLKLGYDGIQFEHLEQFKIDTFYKSISAKGLKKAKEVQIFRDVKVIPKPSPIKKVGTYTSDYKKWSSTGTKEQREALYDYMDEDFSDFRNCQSLKVGCSEELLKKISVLDEFLAKAPTKPQTVYRGMSFSKEDYTEFVRDVENSKELIDKSFMSTSTSQEVAEDFAFSKRGVVLKIEGKSGVDVSPFDSTDPDASGENEVLFRRGSKFKYVKTTKRKTGRGLLIKVLHLTEVL